MDKNHKKRREENGFDRNGAFICDISATEMRDDGEAQKQKEFNKVGFRGGKWPHPGLDEEKKEANLHHGKVHFLRIINCCVNSGEKQSTKEIHGAPPAAIVLVQAGVDVGKRDEEMVSTKEREWERKWNTKHRNNDTGDDTPW